MTSSATRYDIVVEALNRAGRDVGLRELAEKMLNRMLRKWAIEYKYPILRKVGAVQTLGSGDSTIALPSDLGAGIDNLLFGDERVPLYERSSDEFSQFNGYNPSTGKPTFYMVDQQASVVRFNTEADKDYAIQAIYYRVPDDIAVNDSTGDATQVWLPDDELVIQGLIQMIYQFTNDEREGPQYQLVKSMKSDYRNGSVPMGGGVNKILLSPRAFRRTR